MTTKQACRFPDRKTVRTNLRHDRQKNGTRPSFVTKRQKTAARRIRYFHPLPLPDGNNGFSDNRI